MSEAVSKYKSVSTEPARARHAARLAKLGIPAPYNAVAESARMAFFPLYVAIVRRRDGERVVAVDGLNRIVAPTLGAALSRNIHWLRESL